MNKDLIIWGLCGVSVLISIISVFFIRAKIKQVSELPSVIIGDIEKENKIELLTTYLKIILGIFVVTCINLFIPNSIWKFFIPFISIALSSWFMTLILDDTEVYNVKKDEVEIYIEAQNKKKEEMKRQKEIMKEELKHKKEQAKNKTEQ